MKKYLVVAGGAAALSLGLAAPAASAAPVNCDDHPTPEVRVDQILGELPEEVTKFKQAAREGRQARKDLNRYFAKSVRCAQVTFKLAVADDRETLKAVLTDAEATEEEKVAAKDAYKAATAPERAERKATVVEARSAVKDAKKEVRSWFKATVKELKANGQGPKPAKAERA
jgi:chromatin segregation and condensation protein Rec8/ScpA/Scc1 (kleisin family)